ncbi:MULTISPECIES: D-alanyl-D-alanine carboxypeptidase family protein [Methylobacterium]|jgi:D-alanyl-D-alanine carboxypeptidase|uniref:D-alanyl-D-alanine carboxypeptidase family protein n=1 Tax=Methylobacterium TaxID=407 RepID=UPI0008E62E7A|nr:MULTISPECIES: D-alanyl-D-alanine carboxypeptidase family protein [Methylobacterium]MBK3400144.1 serine hydrolase [Methylobacterium ajmalii]MBK3407346.1 serine hydrolase [Methylobacterium ajmalii]MBZ6414443.1 serine hydrolase [Methylobacterium sp.]SFE87548.1 D-alanyl-D-alanine carboxypeptidase [Methylobacterium sp. yr596]
MFNAALLPRLAGRLLGLGALLAAGTAGAVTAPMLVVDVDSGKVIYSQGATDPWFPASITKLMTTYVALDMVRQGRASMDQLLTISEAAAAEPPSKMGFKPGTQLTLDNALKIIMVKSANDVAWAIGENLGGSIDGFAAQMNETAQRLGMRDSRWTNPNGLPDPRQWTSARDMAVLGRALLRDFPENRDLFSISAIQFGRAVMPNHNGLLGRYAGVDGMKTGFICSGGFNVVASANRNGRRILTVVMGQSSARERDLKAADLFDYGFGQSGFSFGGQTLAELPASSIATPPDMRPYICDKRRPMPTDADSAALTASAAAAGGNADNANAQLMAAGAPPSSALAFATMNSAALRNRALPPRAPLQPVLVWTGRDPAESAIAATDEAAPAKPVAARPAARVKVAKPVPQRPAPSRSIAATGATVPQPKLLARHKGAAPAAASAFASTSPSTAVIAEPKGHKAAAKPAAKHDAKQDSKPAAKPAPKAETKPAAKPTVKSARKKDD